MSTVVKKESTSPFVLGLRTRSAGVNLARTGEPSIKVRVQSAELWEAVTISASPNEPVVSIKRAALDAMGLSTEHPEEFVVKLRGWEVLDEGASLADAGAIDGSIFLLTHRRRRPVR
jgi:hypothetical protein